MSSGLDLSLRPQLPRPAPPPRGSALHIGGGNLAPMDVRQAIYERHILANASIRYFEDLSDLYRLGAKIVDVLAFLLASSAAVSITQKSAAWALTFTIAGAVLAAISLVVRLSDTAALCASAAKHWSRRWNLWQSLWLKVANAAEAIDPERYQLELDRDLDYDRPPTWYWRGLSVRAQEQAVFALTRHDEQTNHPNSHP